MFKKLSKVGNSRAIVIDKAILKLLKISDDTKISLKIDGNKLILEPVLINKISDDKSIQELYDEIVEEYDETLKKLAK